MLGQCGTEAVMPIIACGQVQRHYTIPADMQTSFTAYALLTASYVIYVIHTCLCSV